MKVLLIIHFSHQTNCIGICYVVNFMVNYYFDVVIL